MSKKVRIFKLAKELNIGSDTLISFLTDKGFEVKNVNSPVDETMYETVMENFSAEKTMAEKKEVMRHKRAVMRGDIEDSEVQVAVQTIDGILSKPKETRKPAILEALASLQQAAAQAAEAVEEVEETVAEEAGMEIIPDIKQDAKEKAETKEKTAKELQAKKEVKLEEIAKVDQTPESEEVVMETLEVQEESVADEKASSEKGKIAEAPQPVVEKIEAVEELLPEAVLPAEEPVEKEEPAEKEKPAELKLGDKITTIELPPPEPKKSKRTKKGRKEEEDKKPRKLSVKGKGVAEKIREKKKKETVVLLDDTDDTGISKGKKRKRVRRKRIDSKEVEASIRETIAKMGESSKLKKYKKKVKSEEGEVEEDNVINIAEYISVAELASFMEIETNEVIKKCMELGLIVSINQRLDMDTLIMVADEFGFEVNEIEEYVESDIEDEEEDSKSLELRPPVITIMGHVDHGKTSLLDFIRESNVVAGETGGITQHIGAYEVNTNAKKITFLDTPGHEAFTAMRARGTQITDMVVLVIAADDNVMPQTVEALNHAQAAGVPIIIAFNKIDKPSADVERVKKQLSEHNVLVESWGGKYQSVEISAKTGAGVDDLLEIMLFQSELMELKANPKGKIKGAVIESKLEKGRGAACTILVQNGTMKVGDYFVCGQFSGRVRAMYNERGQKVKEAPPSTPVQILGFAGMPQAGDSLIGMGSDKEAKELALKRQILKREHDFRKTSAKSLFDISEQVKHGVIKELLIILKADTDGSVEAIEDSFLKLTGKNVEIKIIHKSIGAITEADVLLASASHAIIIGFHVRPNLNARNIAAKENIDIRLYDVIYDAISDVKTALEGLLEPEISEEIEATVEVRDIFRVPKVGTIAGSYVVSGTAYRNSKVRIIRDGVVVHDGIVESLRRFKDDVKEVATGYECGIGSEGFNDIKVGDILETYKTIDVKSVLD
ncbi:translation initiation factor IF-2 [candidate division KSB1 bacterium]|nr:translation initiation factor IF-2 [candidate division KSB1 bacterium]